MTSLLARLPHTDPFPLIADPLSIGVLLGMFQLLVVLLFGEFQVALQVSLPILLEL